MLYGTYCGTYNDQKRDSFLRLSIRKGSQTSGYCLDNFTSNSDFLQMQWNFKLYQK